MAGRRAGKSGRRTLRAIDRLAAFEPEADREALVADIICGDVTFDGELVRDPKASVPRDSEVAYRAAGFVGRGGIKLDHALTEWEIDVAGKVILDAGASTGGFTHALLLRGAAAVHAVDVGYNQLDYRLRTDPRVLVHERTNIMDVTTLDPAPQIAVVDLSFRSLSGAATHILGLTTEHRAIALIKPQFEWRDSPPGFDGRVPDGNAETIVAKVLDQLLGEGVKSGALIESPIRGRSGNREFLALLELVD